MMMVVNPPKISGMKTLQRAPTPPRADCIAVSEQQGVNRGKLKLLALIREAREEPVWQHSFHPAERSFCFFGKRLLRPRHLNPAGVDRDIPLNLHLDRRAYIQLYIRTVFQERPRHSTSEPGKSAIPCAVVPTRRRASDGSHSASNGCEIGRASCRERV